MAVEVFFHQGTFAEFFQPINLKHPGLSDVLKSEFVRYIESDRTDLPSIFGKDSAYMQPPQAVQACLMHIHIKIPPAEFPKNLPGHQRTCARGKPGEDAALVYVPGELEEDRYLILAFLWPDAHGRSRDRATMKYLSRLAKDWRDKN
jgi:mRNA interferase YafO